MKDRGEIEEIIRKEKRKYEDSLAAALSAHDRAKRRS
jgi:hypothetical protein